MTATKKPDRLVIFDTTLRDGEQSPGASMTLDEKLRIAEVLDELGVDYIEAGFPIASNGDFEAVRAIAATIQNATVCGLARAHDGDIDRAAEALQSARRKRIHTFISTSPLHMQYKLQMEPDEVHAAVISSVSRARNYTDDVEWSPEDGSRTEHDFLCRCETRLDEESKNKIGLFCNVAKNAVIEALDVSTIYEVPLVFEEGGVGDLIVDRLNLQSQKPDLVEWKRFVERVKNPQETVKIAVCGKYIGLKDSYKSIIESFIHAGVTNNARVEVEWIDSEEIESNGIDGRFNEVSGILIPGGFGNRGIEGKIATAKYARENQVPYFGICLGMQCGIIEFARNVCGWKNANGSEFSEKTSHPVIDLMEEQKRISNLGGTMRLGAYICKIKPATRTYELYGQAEITERHRHRYEVNNLYVDEFEKKGLEASGVNPETNLVEIVELHDHPWYFGVQFHPELKSRVLAGHPLFREFVKAAILYKRNKQQA